MIELVRREFDVDVAIDEAWQHLARVTSWPTWAKHIKSVRLSPGDTLTATSQGQFRLKGGARSTFRVSVFDPPRRWLWVGRFLTTNVHYDHLFEPVGDDKTRLTWIVSAEGRGEKFLGRPFARLYSRNLDRAIPRLQAEYRDR